MTETERDYRIEQVRDFLRLIDRTDALLLKAQDVPEVYAEAHETKRLILENIVTTGKLQPVFRATDNYQRLELIREEFGVYTCVGSAPIKANWVD